MDLRVSTHAHEYKDLDAVKLFVNECAGHVLHGLFPAFALYELTGHGVHNKVSEVAVDKAAYPALHSQASLFIFGFEIARIPECGLATCPNGQNVECGTQSNTL